MKESHLPGFSETSLMKTAKELQAGNRTVEQ